MRHNPLTVVAPIAGDPSAERRVADRLRGIGEVLEQSLVSGASALRISSQALEELRALPGVHFLSLVVVPSEPDGSPAYVILEMNHDGARAPFLQALSERAHDALALIFGECAGFPGSVEGTHDRASLRAYLERHDVGADVYYVGCPGRGLEQIQEERTLREVARSALSSIRGANARDVFAQLRAVLGQQLPPELLRPQRRPFWVRFGLHAEGLPRRLSSVGRGAAWALGWGGVGLGWLAIVARPDAWTLGVFGAALAAAAIAILLETPRHFLGGAGRELRRAQLHSWLRACKGAAVASGALGLVRLLLAGDPGVGMTALLGALAGATPHALALLLVPAFALPSVLVGLALHVAAGARLGLVAAGAAAGAGAAAWWLAYGSPVLQGLWAVTLLGVVGIGVVAPLYLALLVYARRSELDHREGELAWDHAHQVRVQRHEDRTGYVQNHLATVSRVRPGRRPRRLLAIALRGVSLLVRLKLNRGERSGVPAIHFARFVRLPDRQRLLFLSNYDGPFGAYLTAFRNVPGVNAIWGQSEGFPRGHFLTGGGAQNTALFKAIARQHQVETLAWYSAYRDLRVRDIDAATELRERLATPLEGEGERAWQRLWQRRFRRPLDEASCDRAWRGV